MQRHPQSNTPLHQHSINLLLKRGEPEKQNKRSCCPHYCIGNSGDSASGKLRRNTDWIHRSVLRNLLVGTPMEKLFKYENFIDEDIRKKDVIHNLTSWISFTEPTATGSLWHKFINKTVHFHWETRMQLKTTITIPMISTLQTPVDNSAHKSLPFPERGELSSK